MNKILLFAGLLSGSLLLPAQSFTPHDILVSSALAKIGDPEFDPVNKRICWQSIDDHKLWICNLDTNTWGLSVPDGKQTVLDAGLIPLAQTLNAGEWGFSENGAYIFYNKLIGNVPYVAAAVENGTAWSLNTLTDAPNRFNPRATKNPGDAVAMVQYVTFPGTGTTKYKYANAPTTEYSIPNFKDAHWAEDEQILTGILPNNQVGLFNPASPGAPVQLTFTPSDTYSRPYMWRAPEYQGARMFFAKANGSEIRVFKESSPGSNTYTPFMQFSSPSSRPDYNNIGSPEPVIYQGKSYISFMASSSPLETSGAPAEIWIASVDSLTPLIRMVSDDVLRVRTDPEPFPTDSTLFIYYTEVNDSLDASSYGVIDPTTLLKLRRCDTGIKAAPTTAIQPENTAAWVVFPNPFREYFGIMNLTGQESFTLSNATGQIMFSGKDIQDQDFSSLPAGVYILRSQTKNRESVQRLIKQ